MPGTPLDHFRSVPGRLGGEARRAWNRIRARLRDDALAHDFARELLFLNLLLIALPVVLILAAAAGLPSPANRDFFHPGRDGSLPEMFNYVQTALVSVFLILTWRLRGSWACLAWAALFAFVLLDDSLRYHETVGAWLAATLDLGAVAGLRAVDSGELLAWALAGAVLLPLVAAALLRTGGEERGFALLIGAAFAALVFCGVAVDMLHQFTGWRALTLIEDGGEMLAIAAACILSFTWYREARAVCAAQAATAAN